MAVVKKDLHNQLAIIKGVNPVVTGSTAQTGATFDRAAAGDDSPNVAIVFYFGTYTDGTWTPGVEESDDDSAWSAATSYSGTLTAVDSATAEDDVIQAVSYTGSKRYVRGVLAETANGTTGVEFAMLYIGAGGSVNQALEAGA